MTAWHMPERVMELLKRCEDCGLNTFQNSYSERTLSDLERYRAAGGAMNWLCLGNPDWDEHPEFIDDAAKHKPIGISRAYAPLFPGFSGVFMENITESYN